MTAEGRADQIAQDLRRDIDSGRYKPGERLPLTRELTQKYDVTGETVRQAVIKLKAAGLVRSTRGSGVYVRESRPVAYRPQAEFQLSPESAEMQNIVVKLHSEGETSISTPDVETVVPSAAIQERLQLGRGQRVLTRRGSRSLEGELYSFQESYFPLRLVKGSAIASVELPIGHEDAVLEALGHKPVRAVDEIYVRMPTPEQTKRLKLGEGTPVALLQSTAYSADGLPVRTTVTVLPGDRHVIAYERTRPEPGTHDSTPA